MSEDIFVPTSSPDDAIVGPLHTVTYVTADKDGVDSLLSRGYGMQSSAWSSPSGDERDALNNYLGFDSNDTWEVCVYTMPGDGANVQIRVICVDEDKPQVRKAYDGLYHGGATISCPMVDMRAHHQHMQSIGVESTIGVKEMEFTSPSGETYISAEIVYMAPENVYLMGVTRPDIFVPVGPIDPATGIGGPAYSARCVVATDATIEFFRDVLGYEIRRDVEFVVDEKSAIRLPEGTKERFIQGFAPGAQTGYIVMMDHGDPTKRSDAPQLGPPSRGIGMWSFPTHDIEQVFERAKAANIDVVHGPSTLGSPFLGGSRCMLMHDPDGFPIEIFEN